MNELTVQKQNVLLDKIKQAFVMMNNIASFDDVKRLFLMGGDSNNTYKNYLTAVKQLYDFTNGLNPLQLQPAHIEEYYDSILEKNSLNTAYIRIQGLKKFFKGMEKQIPFYNELCQNPFSLMSKKLKAKLNRSIKSTTKKALTYEEYLSMMEYLQNKPKTILNIQNYTLSKVLFSTGLRISALLNLTFGDIERDEKGFYVTVLSKGSKFRTIRILPEVMQTIKNCLKAQHNKIENNMYLFSNTVNNDYTVKLTSQCVWHRLKKLWVELQDNKIITRKLQFSPHLFRRTSGTYHYKVTHDLVSTQKHLGHSSPVTTQQNYVDVEAKRIEVFTGKCG
jgi:integrase